MSNLQMDNSRFLTHDGGVGSIETADDSPSLDSPSFTWDEQSVVRLDNEPWVEFFDTDTFYKFESTVARPIEQTYHIEGDEYTFKKPAEELRKAQWSLDNRPFPITHPDSGLVRNIDDVHGFGKNPRFVEHDDEPDESRVDIYVPVNDAEAKEFVTEYQDVSVGFFNQLDWDVDEEGVDAYQRDLFYDHVAGVRIGRCSGEDGCGLHTDDGASTWTARTTDLLDASEDSDEPTPFQETAADDVAEALTTTPAVTFYEPDFTQADTEGSGRASLSDFTTGSSPQWSDLSYSEQRDVAKHFIVAVDTNGGLPDTYNDLKLQVVNTDGTLVRDRLVEAYRKVPQVDGLNAAAQYRARSRIAALLDYDAFDNPIKNMTNIVSVGDNAVDDDGSDDGDAATNQTDTNTMTCDCGNQTTDKGQILGGLSVDEVATHNDEVAELQEDLKAEQEEVESLQDEVGDLQETVDEYERQEYEDAVDELTDLTDHWGDAEELLEAYEDGAKAPEDVEEHIDTARNLMDLSEDGSEGAEGGGQATKDAEQETDDADETDPTTIGDSEGSQSSGTTDSGPVFQPETAQANRQ